MIFITLKTSDKKCLKIEKAWFLLVHWVVKNNRLIFLCHFHLSMSFFAIFQRKRQFEKHAICLVKLLFTCQPRNRVFIFFFYFFLVTLPGLIDTLAQLLALRSNRQTDFIKYKQKKASLDRAGKLTTSGMDSLMERLQVELVLEDSVALITNARRSGTNAHYESAWRKWHSWSSKRKVYPIKFSVNKILQFLTKCFNIGTVFKYNFRVQVSHLGIP